MCIKFVNFSTSGVSIKAHWILNIELPVETNMSPRPINWLAPTVSKIVLLSIPWITLNAILVGKFALIVPVIMFVVGLCVAIIRWIPTALDSWASLAMGISISLPAVIIRSANSSMTKIK